MNNEEQSIGPAVASLAHSNVLSLAGGLYSGLVSLLVESVNQGLADCCTQRDGNLKREHNWIVIVDRPGLNNLSGEGTMADLCRNLAHEVSTQQFASHEKHRYALSVSDCI